jgi:hypothetical protein
MASDRNYRNDAVSSWILSQQTNTSVNVINDTKWGCGLKSHHSVVFVLNSTHCVEYYINGFGMVCCKLCWSQEGHISA